MNELGRYQLPSGWKWSTIPDLVGDEGLFCDGDWIETEDQDPNGDVRLVQLADVGDGTYRDRSARFLTTAKARKLRCTFLKPADVLIARMPDPLGRACVFPGDQKPAVTAVDVCIVRSNNGDFDHRWLAWFVNAPPFRNAIAGLQSGSTRKRISRKNLGTIPLPVPPVNEQQQIVAEIEKQFTRLEAGVADLRRVQANLKRYRAAVLKAACEGKLVPTEAELASREGRTYETGAQLLKRVLAEHRQKWNGKGKYKEPATSNTTILSELPEGWTWALAGQLCDCVVPNRDKPKSFSGPIPWITLPDFEEDRIEIGASRFGLGLSEEEAAKYRAKVLPRDTVVMSCVGRFGITAVLKGRAVVNQQLHAFLPSIAVQPKYLAYALRTQGKYMSETATATTIQYMNKNNCNNVPVPLPSLEEQERIVAEMERRLSVVEELDAIVNANLQRATRLRLSILQQVFEGKLFDAEASSATRSPVELKQLVALNALNE